MKVEVKGNSSRNSSKGHIDRAEGSSINEGTTIINPKIHIRDGYAAILVPFGAKIACRSRNELSSGKVIALCALCEKPSIT